MIPLYKNDELQRYEARIDGNLIAVPFPLFENALTSYAQRRIDESHEEAQAARNAVFFDIIDAQMWNTSEFWVGGEADPKQESTEGAKGQEEDGAGQMCWSVEMDIDGSEAALERMANYFQQKYQHAKEGGDKEAQYGALYVHIVSALSQRDLVESVDQVSAHLSDLTKTLCDISHELATVLSSVGVALALLGTKEDDDAPRTPAPHA